MMHHGEGKVRLKELARLFESTLPTQDSNTDSLSCCKKLFKKWVVLKIGIEAKNAYYSDAGQGSKALHNICRSLFGLLGYETALDKANKSFD